MMLSLSVVFLQSCSHIKKDLEEINSDDTKKEEPGKADRFAFLKSEMREIPKDTVTTESINEELVKTEKRLKLPGSITAGMYDAFSGHIWEQNRTMQFS